MCFSPFLGTRSRGAGGGGGAPKGSVHNTLSLSPRATVKCNRQPADKGPLARGAATHIEHCVRSIYSLSGAASLATLVVPHSTMSVGEAWTCVTTSIWWSCGNPGVELRYTMCNVGCSTCLFVCFTTPYWPVLLRNTQGRLPMGTSRRHGLCYGASTLGPGLGSHYAHMLAISDFVPVLSIGSH